MTNKKITFYSINPLKNFDQVRKIWTHLQENSPHSFFLSWAWIETWLDCLPNNQNISFVYGTLNDKPVLGYFFGFKRGFGSCITYCSRGYLNSTGIEELDEITIEYNGILFDKSVSQCDLTDLLKKDISPWDELICPASSKELLSIFESTSKSLNIKLIQSRPSYYVNLDKVRENNNDLLSLVSKNKKAQIKRTKKCYEKDAEFRIEIADNIDQALNYLDGLNYHHQKNWTSKGHPGSFSNKFFCEFHKTLISKHFHEGIIQLIKISCGTEVVGYLYNFIYQGTVLFYQSGLNYREGNLYRPGLICHYLAINYCANKGYSKYDFLEGDSSYKKSLATDNNELHWIKCQRNKVRFKLEDSLRYIKNKLNN